MKESSAVEIIWYDEDKVIDQSLHEEVTQSFHEKQDEIFVRVSDKSSFNNSVINDNYYLSKRKQKVLSPLFEDEIDQLLKGHAIAQAKADL